jgi:hypothetical protein
MLNDDDISSLSRQAENRSTLPAVTQSTAGYRSAQSAAPRAAFISQLIAERQHLPIQRQRRQSTVDVALDAYGATERNAVVRLPPGYRTTLLV